MKLNPPANRLYWLACTLLLASLAGGCHWCHAPPHHGHHHAMAYTGWGEPGLCFGYHPTCWRPWPEECVGCPPFGYDRLDEEIGKPQPDLLPPDAMPVEPVPTEPAEAEAPVVPPLPDAIPLPTIDP